MNGQRGQLGKLVGRMVLGLATTATAAAAAASLVLLAPPAAASPQTEADDAITAAWQKGGGEASVLGAKQGDVYAVGEGFAQNFAGGKIFFTEATGARSLYGAILDKYESLGGPVASGLGFPTINEVPGLASPDSRVSIFSASDKPVIFWTPDRGAFVVRGAMNAAWDKLGSSGGVLGVPVADETSDGEVVTQKFSGGQVSWNRVTNAFTTVPPELAQQLTGVQGQVDPGAAIDMTWRAAGGASGKLGAKQGEPYAIGNEGFAQDFAGGKIYFSQATGANAVGSDILAKYESLGGPLGSDLGFPTASEADGGIPNSRISTFSAADKPVIFWTRDHGAFVVRGAMQVAWDKLRGASGKLGAPVGDQTVAGDMVSQKFTGGKISWNRTKNTYSTEPSNLASLLSGLQVPGQNTPSGVAPPPAGHKGFTWNSWHWWYWLVIAISAALVLIGGIVALVIRKRRKKRSLAVESPDLEFDRRIDYDDADGEWPSELEGDIDAATSPEGYSYPPAHTSDAGPAAPAASWPHGSTVPVGLAESALTVEARTTAVLPDSAGGASSGFEMEDTDAVDTAPTRIPSLAEMRRGRHAAAEPEEEIDDAWVSADVGTGHQFLVPEPGQIMRPLLRLPLDDPYEVPAGYPVKGNASLGLYYTPGSALYADTLAEVWFVSEEVARANGFTNAD